MENYHILERIGEGSFGKVYRGRRKYTGQIVALKFVTKRGKSAKDLQSLREEINILRRLNHCNIIAMLDSFETEGEFCMVTEYAQGELFQVLEDDHQLPETEIRPIAIQLVQALHLLHTKRIIHRDMKPQNILIGSKQQIKLADFGFARALSNEASLLTSIKGTPLYMAPELVQEKPYNYTVDLWSLGVILYELAVGRPPFYTDRIVTLIQMIVREPVKYPSTMSLEFKSFLSGLLQKEPHRRMSWKEILQHPFILETSDEMVKRESRERTIRPLPRFFSQENHDACASRIKPSEERLRTSKEWKICDPETGQQVESVVSNTHTVIVSPQADDTVPTFLEARASIEQYLQAGTTSLLEYRDWKTLWNTFLQIQAEYMSPEILSSVSGIIIMIYRALLTLFKQPARESMVQGLVETRKHLHLFLHAFLQRVLPTTIDATHADVLYQCVRVCTMFSNIINTNYGTTTFFPLSFRQCSSSDVGIITKLLHLRGEAVTNTVSKTLKWLGAMLDRSLNLTEFLEQVHPSGMIEALCEILSASSEQRSPTCTPTSSTRELGIYAIFALSTCVQPDGRLWGRLQAFPIMSLTPVNEENPTVDVRQLYKLRVKMHTEVTTQLLRHGLQELVSTLEDEIMKRITRKQRTDDDHDYEEEEGGHDEDEEDQSTISCVVKILLHACRSSSPLSKKLTLHKLTKLDTSSSTEQTVVGLMLTILQSSTLHVVEMYYVVDFLTVILRRQVLSKQQIWSCALVLYPLLIEADDVGLLSVLCTFFADVIESALDLSTNIEAEFGVTAKQQHEVHALLVQGVISKRCADSVFRLFRHESYLASRSPKLQMDRLHMLSCYNVRAQGLVDAGVVLLLRIATKAMKQAAVTAPVGTIYEPDDNHQNHALTKFVAMFEHPSSWNTIQQLMIQGGNDLLSPWGLFCFLKLVRMIRELQSSDTTMELRTNEHIVPQLVALLHVRHIEYLFQWPEVVGGGNNAVKALVHAIVKVLGIPFMHSISEGLLVATQEVLYDVQCVQKLLGVLEFIFTTRSFQLEMSVLELPMSFLSRLVTSSEHFGRQFVEAHGVKIIKECGMLSTNGSSSLIIDTLLILSQLARGSPEYYECILEAGFLSEFKELVVHSESMVRAKALNCVGNLCRHSTLFYDQFVVSIEDGGMSPTGGHTSSSVLERVIRGLSDSDAYVRRFACFAIGNAAFHNNRLYSALQPSIVPLIKNLHDAEEKTRSNAAGALGNLVRNSDELCTELCRVQAPLELFELAMTDTSISSRRIILFSLGNFCAYPVCLESIKRVQPEFTLHIEHLLDMMDTDELSKKNIRRILAKVEAHHNDGYSYRLGEDE